ncbi:UDP-glucosyltransferase 2-like [Venturia canescens]|uniref:UDP-glucosyltransferase 2-like n=1 Tax=Venturia canescens TaxID=32260 RepID=UPI001C9C15A1|nr:UDP-glucosyltransferase 2-like [Venturia canescens]XP_043268669.1 UDP-glucosyltransferase 2-like [Venturia canescens]XP_043268671.1 UDP-glucosyltransferase 2-like [Venturia canescens]
MKGITLLIALSCASIIGPQGTESYRILGVFPFHGKSHFMMFEALMKGLARRGHQIDVISPFPLKKPYPNYTDIIRIEPDQPQVVNNMSFDTFQYLQNDMTYFIATAMGNKICEQLEKPKILNLIQNPPTNPPYDLVMTEIFGAHCFIAFGHHLKIPTIGLSSAALYPWGNGIIGNPANLAFVPNNLINYVAPMTFWQRLCNTVHSFSSEFIFHYYSTPQTALMKKYFGKNTPDIRSIERSVALLLVNSHPSLNDPRPVTPGLVEVGGLHVQDDDTELPLDLKEWMDSSKDGFIYFTFGSMVTIETFPKEILDIFYKSLGKIAPIRVLMKIVDTKKLPAELPKNFRTFVWAPQTKVLQHKNIKAFFTHGGLMGGQEAIHFAVPMIGMPLFADQYINVDLYVRKNISLKLIWQEITEEKLDYALKEILHNPKYKNAVTKLSQKFLDRPMSSMDTAIYWVEYVVRHGSGVLRSPAMDLAWWQIELLDVYVTLVFILSLLILAVFISSQFVYNLLFFKKVQMVTDSKKIK